MEQSKTLLNLDELTVADFKHINFSKVLLALLHESRTSKSNFSDPLLSLAEHKAPDIFIVEFRKKYPVFAKEIDIRLPKLSPTDLKTCYLLRLDLSTKEIAQITNSSIRAVESRKYRIRKRLNLKTEVNLNLFLIQLDQKNH